MNWLRAVGLDDAESALGVSAVNWLRERSAQRTAGAAWREPAAVVAGAEMWT